MQHRKELQARTRDQLQTLELSTSLYDTAWVAMVPLLGSVSIRVSHNAWSGYYKTSRMMDLGVQEDSAWRSQEMFCRLRWRVFLHSRDGMLGRSTSGEVQTTVHLPVDVCFN